MAVADHRPGRAHPTALWRGAVFGTAAEKEMVLDALTGTDEDPLTSARCG